MDAMYNIKSLAVKPGVYPNSCGKYPSISLNRSPICILFSPLIFTSPAVGSIIPQIICIKVVFPAPLAPKKPYTPSLSSVSILSTAILFLNCLDKCSIANLIQIPSCFF